MMTYELNYGAMEQEESFVPEHMRNPIKDYLERGVPGGGYLSALLSNNIKEAVGRADQINKRHMVTTVQWLTWYAPRNAWGSPEAVESWKGFVKE